MTNRNLPLFIDLAFCLVLLPIMIMLLPIERWLTSNMVFVCILVGWLYIVYITNRCLTVPFMFRRKKYLVWSLVILILMIVITWLITQYQLDMPRHFRRPPGGRPRPNESSLRLHQQGVWFLFLVVTVFSLAMGLLTELFRQIMARHEVEFEKKKAELALYKAQINPHFLFNSLNTLYGMVVTQSEKAEAAFMQFIQLMKYMYSNASKDFIPVQTEIEYIRQYIEMQKYRMNEYTRIHFSYTDDKGTPDAVIAPMLLITFVENAIKHALRLKEGKRRLWIRVMQEGERVVATVCDNGGGYRRQSVNRGTGTGMKVITQTIQLLNSYNRQSIVMTISNVPVEDGETGCEVRFTIPLHYSYRLTK